MTTAPKRNAQAERRERQIPFLHTGYQPRAPRYFETALQKNTRHFYQALNLGLFSLAHNSLEFGIEVNRLDENLNTPLMTTIIKGSEFWGQNYDEKNESLQVHSNIICALIKMGSNVNAKNRFNDTPLIIAVRNLLPYAVEILLKNEADMNIKGYHGTVVEELSKLDITSLQELPDGVVNCLTIYSMLNMTSFLNPTKSPIQDK